MSDLLNDLKGFEPGINDDSVVDFSKPVKCGAKAKITEAGRKSGVSNNTGNNYDFLFIKMQITEVLSADTEEEKKQAKNRFIDGTIYSLVDSDFATAADNIKKLLNDLNTMGAKLTIPVDIDEPQLFELLETHLSGLKDKIIDVRCYPKGKDKDKQGVKIVDRSQPKAAGKASNSPF